MLAILGGRQEAAAPTARGGVGLVQALPARVPPGPCPAAGPGLLLPSSAFVPSLDLAAVGRGWTESERRGSRGRGSPAAGWATGPGRCGQGAPKDPWGSCRGDAPGVRGEGGMDSLPTLPLGWGAARLWSPGVGGSGPTVGVRERDAPLMA